MITREDFAELAAAWSEMEAALRPLRADAATGDIVAALLIVAMQVNEASTRICDAIDALTVAA